MRCSLAFGPRYANGAATRTLSIDSFKLYYSAVRSAITVTSAYFRATLSVLENFGETEWTAQRICAGWDYCLCLWMQSSGFWQWNTGGSR
ncbi:MAG: hypothetical protein F6K55_26305 [Moorea sp. SIO4A3]|nr:hypothetical protein [Moorena sp. SIO4A3]